MYAMRTHRLSVLSICLYWAKPVISFASPPQKSLFGSSTITTTGHGLDTTAIYSDPELQAALDSLLDDSKDPDFDAHHIYGHADSNHKLSMLQRITATVILDYQNYVQHNNQQIQQHAAAPSIPQLLQAAHRFCETHGPILNLQKVIQSCSPRMALAAEFKRASPSKGDIAPDIQAGRQGVQYATAGADIVSVLTEPRWFKGSLDDLTEIRLATTTTDSDNSGSDHQRRRPAILRKDFVVSEYMIAEAAAAGADTVLLIVAVLPGHLLKRLIDYSRSLGMEPLVEVHALDELQVALGSGAKVIGVNNRNLHTFQMDLANSERIAHELTRRGLSFHHDHNNSSKETPGLTLCALSGMSSAYDVDRYRQVGLGMCLIGESLMRAADPAAAIASLCLHPNDFRKQTSTMTAGGAYTAGTQLVKVCGITNAQDALVACQSGVNLVGVIFAEKSKRRVTEAQAREVVEAVRRFGERDRVMSLNLPESGSTPPLPHLVACSRALVQAAEKKPMVVGVFQNQDPVFVRQMVEQCGLDLVQLHGSEGMEAANAAQCGAPAIRVVDIAVDAETGETSSQAVETILRSITSDPVAILLDTAIKGKKEGGGTGQAFDWSIAQRVQDAGLPVIVAGGLTADSIEECIGSIRPFGVDVSSGVEASPGRKNHELVLAFVQRAKKAALEASKGF